MNTQQKLLVAFRKEEREKTIEETKIAALYVVVDIQNLLEADFPMMGFKVNADKFLKDIDKYLTKQESE